MHHTFKMRSQTHPRFFYQHGIRPKYNVPLNVEDKGSFYEAYIYAYGFTKDNIILNVNHDVLEIKGNREISNNPTFSIQEFPVKTFERKINLNNKVQSEKITAKHEEGILKIKLPKREPASSDSAITIE